jgi:hypothetical protein
VGRGADTAGARPDRGPRRLDTERRGVEIGLGWSITRAKQWNTEARVGDTEARPPDIESRRHDMARRARVVAVGRVSGPPRLACRAL